MEGETASMGFYTTRWVEAVDEEEARSRALEALRAEPPLTDVPRGCGAEVTWEEIEVVEEADVPAVQGGFAFFPMEQ